MREATIPPLAEFNARCHRHAGLAHWQLVSGSRQ